MKNGGDTSTDGPLLFALAVLAFAVCAMAATAAVQASAKGKKSPDEWRAACLKDGGAVAVRTRLGVKAQQVTDYVCERPQS